MLQAAEMDEQFAQKHAQTDVQSVAHLEPTADGFRNYFRPGQALSPVELLVDRADQLTLSVPEMTVLVG
ncbi:MAG TPA: hypothetical protein DEH78_22715, partial [Solibacterales bacterium]|nr:hypothetical protein [Bryobacterales bacterium]